MSKQIHLDKVLASLNTICPKCKRVIHPSEIRRVGADEMLCPACGARFKAQPQPN